MAQYGRNFYGTSYYGDSNVFSGWYETREIFTDELLKGTVSLKMRATLPSATYAANGKEVAQHAGVWDYDASANKLYGDDPNGELILTATCDHITIKYEQRTVAANVAISVISTPEGGLPVTTNYTLNTQAGTVNANATYVISNLPYGQQKVHIKLSDTNPANAHFNFKGFIGRTANVGIESRARLKTGAAFVDSDYIKVNLTVTPIEGTTNEFFLTGTTPSCLGKNMIQHRIHLGSSDDDTTPILQYLELLSGNTENRTEDGQWTAVFNMVEIAALSSKTFATVEEIVWTEEVPTGTDLLIRSASSSDNNVIWDKTTVPYHLNTKRIRLKEGHIRGWIDAPLVSPALNKPHVSTIQWDSWEDRSYLPPDSAGTGVIYKFLNTAKSNEASPYHRIANPMTVASKNLGGTGLRNLDHFVRINLERTAGKQTPVVDFIKLTSVMRYQQEIEEAYDFSAIDNEDTGKQVILDMSVAGWQSKLKVPSEVTDPTYTLMDRTGRPQDIMLYFDNEKEEAMRTNKTLLLNNKVWAEAKIQVSGNRAGVTKHYQYGGGQVKFPLKDEIHMAPVFSPSLLENRFYRYYIKSGWSTEEYRTVAGDTMQKIADLYKKPVSDFNALNPKVSLNNDGTLVIGQIIQVPNDTVNTGVNIYWKSTNESWTDKSSHNAMLDENEFNLESDSIVAEAIQEGQYQWVDWVSDERIYSGFVNLNDIRSEYKRSHKSPDSGDSAQVEYIAANGDTYEKIAIRFGVYEEDVRKVNEADSTSEPVVGQKVLVPALITLPPINPKAIVEDNPYKIEIIYNSVKKKNGKTLPVDVLTTKPIEITYKRITMTDVEVTRGSIANGKDLLPHPRVVEILKARNMAKTMTYNPWSEFLGTGDFRQDGNYIDWSLVAFPAIEPEAEAVYLVDYVIEIPDKVTVTIDTTYLEEGGVDRIWRSSEVKEFKGMCYPGKDFSVELPSFTEWQGLPNDSVLDLQYVIEDNDIWVKTWVEQRGTKWYVVGSLHDRTPKDNWMPTIQTGYYYLGKDEYYLFSEPIIVEPTNRQIPIATNVEYVPGKFNNAAKLQEASVNLVRNSGFENRPNKQIVYRKTFG